MDCVTRKAEVSYPSLYNFKGLSQQNTFDRCVRRGTFAPLWQSFVSSSSWRLGLRLLVLATASNLRVVRGCLAVFVIALVCLALGITSAPAQDKEIHRALDLYSDVLERVRSDYFKEVDEDKLIEWTIDGILQSLDPHSAYLSLQDLEKMQVQTRGQFGGLGIEVTMENGVLKVVAPIHGTPAYKAGVLAGDLITHLDHRSIAGLTLTKAVERMLGKAGEPIRIRIVRSGHTDPIDLTVVREVIKIDPVMARAEGDVGYIKIVTFNEHTCDKLKVEVERFKAEIGPSLMGYVLDLRNNPGGLPDQAIAVSDAFLEAGAIVITKGRNYDEAQRSQAKKGDVADGAKIVVLMNGGSAAASEIVAGRITGPQAGNDCGNAFVR